MSRFKPGDLVRCTSTKLKYYDFNSVYKVAEYSTSGKSAFKMRMEGSKQFVSYTNFAPADIKAVRAEKLKIIKGDDTKRPVTGRKIDRNKNLDEKKFKLFEILLNRWFTDRKQIDGGGWSEYYKNPYFNYEEFIEKIVSTDRAFDLKKEDFDDIKDMTVSEAFDLFIKMKTKK